MNSLDILLVVIFLLSAVCGLFAGFLRMFCYLLSWLVAGLIATWGTVFVAPWLANYVSHAGLRLIISFSVIFLPCLLLCSLLSSRLLTLFRSLASRGSDRLSGMFLGGLLGLSLVFAVVFLAGFTRFPARDIWQRSALVSPPQRLAEYCAEEFLPFRIRVYHSYVSLPQPPLGGGGIEWVDSEAAGAEVYDGAP